MLLLLASVHLVAVNGPGENFHLCDLSTSYNNNNNNNNNFNDNRGQEGPIVKIRRIILTGVLYVGYSMHS